MDQAFSQREDTQQQQQLILESKYCICTPLLKFSVFAYWVSKSLRSFSQNRVFYGYHRFKGIGFTGMVVNNSVFCALSGFGGELKDKMVENGDIEEENLGLSRIRDGEMYRFGGLVCESISSSDFLTSDATVHEEHSISSFEESSSSSELEHAVDYTRQVDAESEEKHNGKLGSSVSEIEMMKERFSKLLLGEDMSGCGNGVCTALAISNAITNLCATIFGQLWKLEPISPEKKAMWQREMEWLLCVSDQIMELTPTWQIFPDGSKLEVMTCRPRSDLYINLPALRKLDNMLLEILDGFNDNEFWYVDQGVLAPDNEGSTSLRKSLQRQEEKWWLPMPTVSPGGLNESSRKKLQHKRDSTNQILKAAMAINSVTLADMEVPESYLEALPKNGKANLGVIIYRYISSEQFSAECLLDCLDLSSEHQAIEIANRVEASMFVWRKRGNSKPSNNAIRSSSVSSWGLVKEMMIDVDKMELLADRAASLLFCLKQRFPCLPQTALDMSKIQYNKDVGKSILESYSRVLESLAFNIIARIDDLLYVDEFTKRTDKLPSLASVGLISHRSVTIPHVPVPSTPYKTEYATPTFSPSQSTSPAKGDRNRFLTIGSSGLTAKKVLMDYLSAESKGKDYCNLSERVGKTTRLLTISSTENSIVEERM